MDDLIYFLLVVGWLGYSIYKQSEKKKRQQVARQNEQQVNTVSEYPVPAETREAPTAKVPTGIDFRKTLEEILLGQQVSMEVIPESEAQSLEVIPEPAVSDENRFQERPVNEAPVQQRWNEIQNNSSGTTGENYRQSNDEAILHEEEHEKAYFWEEFDLRKAILYSEILKPKYVH
jgi:hypothetical protein